jgi:phosphoribosylformylglycinamidine synthase
VVLRPLGPDPRSERLLADATALGIAHLRQIRAADLVFLAGVDRAEAEALTTTLLADPLLHEVAFDRTEGIEGGVVVETALHPGVTDSVAQAVERGARLAGLSGVRASTGTRFELLGPLDPRDVDRLVTRLLANPVVERHAVGLVHPAWAHDSTPAPVERIPLTERDDVGLQELSAERGLALDLDQMRAVATWFRDAGREPTDVELEMIAQTWSEHCAHTTFRADITWEDGTPVEPLLRQLRASTDRIAAPFVRSAFVGNAGIVAWGDGRDLAIKAETHNHPSAVEPFGGANTGVGGVVRDVLGVSARPIAVTDVLCFGPSDLPPDDLPHGVLHPRLVRQGVIAGVADYGNKLGLPTVAGAIVHDPGYTSNPLVFAGCLGELPAGLVFDGPHASDRVVVIGGRTGRDGIRGATFSSMAMDATTGEVAGASVQIGDPIVEKGLIDVIVAAREARLYTAVTDCGAGGLSSAVGEMAESVGADVDLALVPRKYPGLAPWEVWLSEAQERMVLAVAPAAIGELAALCARYEVDLADIGSFTGGGHVVVRDGDGVVLDLPTSFLHDGRPPRLLTARRPSPPAPGADTRTVDDPAAALLALLAHPSLHSNLDVVHGYDHEVLGGTVRRPYGGAAGDGPADAPVVVPGGAGSGAAGAALGIGVNARYGDLDPYRMACAVVDEAIRNAVAAGADPDHLALLDNFSWGDPRDPSTLGALVDAVRGCCDAAEAHGAPFVSGKDSLNNVYATADGSRRSVPPTLVITALGLVPDPGGAPATDLLAPGDPVYLVGSTRDELRGSHLDLVLGIDGPGQVPAPDLESPARNRALHAAMRAGLVRACHDLAEGGLAVTAAEMVMAGRLGLDLDLTDVASDPVVAMFSESAGRYLVEVAPADALAFETLLGTAAHRIGSVVADPVLRLSARSVTLTDTQRAETLLEVALADLLAAWQGHVAGSEGAR